MNPQSRQAFALLAFLALAATALLVFRVIDPSTWQAVSLTLATLAATGQVTAVYLARPIEMAKTQAAIAAAESAMHFSQAMAMPAYSFSGDLPANSWDGNGVVVGGTELASRVSPLGTVTELNAPREPTAPPVHFDQILGSVTPDGRHIPRASVVMGNASTLADPLPELPPVVSLDGVRSLVGVAFPDYEATVSTADHGHTIVGRLDLRVEGTAGLPTHVLSTARPERGSTGEDIAVDLIAALRRNLAAMQGMERP
ncbi:MAG TPA: hypothetical protein VFE72_02830 [Lysobacter sp.]|nr:hypothetical protein [Lysobacter sp.]